MDWIKNVSEAAKERVVAVSSDELPNDVKEYIIAHPYQTSFYVASGVVFSYPALLSGPLLAAFGWTSVGPRAGKFKPYDGRSQFIS